VEVKNKMSRSRYSRQILFAPIAKEGQERLKQSKVLIVGMGALGTVLANHMVRAGVGHVRFVDRDFVEESNLQRQMLFDEQDVADHLPKAIAAERNLKRINSEVIIEGIVGDVTALTIDQYAQDVNVVLDGTDNFQTRFLMNDFCFKQGIPFVYGGAVSSRGMQATFIPGETPCLRCLIDHSNGASETCDTSGVISPIVDIVASYQSIEAIKLLVGKKESVRRSLLSMDIWYNHHHEIKWTKSKKGCPTCQLKEYPALKIENEDQVTSLCGRETIQITPRGTQSWDLGEWQVKLQKVGQVEQTPFLLRCEIEGLKLVLFPDGRALIQGTDDISRAKSIYTKYIGM
jgi:molybdopterin/thiamine biosynthesis adenylyltransferase